MSNVCLKNTTTRARVCDTCRSSPSSIYCEADLAFLCTSCDSHVHAANKLSSRHKRVLICEACEQAPAAFTCKADSASLCITCDVVIHSANPLSHRHTRVPVMPISGSVNGNQGNGPGPCFLAQESEGTADNEDEEEAASWLLDGPMKNEEENENSDINGFLFNGDGSVDEYLDLVGYNTSCQDIQFSGDHHSNDLKFDDEFKYTNYDDGTNIKKQSNKNYQIHQFNFHTQKIELGMEYETSNDGYGFPPSLVHSVSMSSMDVGVVPESAITPKGSTIDLFSSPSIQVPTQLTPTDRKARVLRYMEKKKTRKFEKTIRYASRKAYAETRPRVKGRFAKRTNIDEEVDQMFSTTLLTEGGYCIVPSF
uniref:zinc finger protein CONSTANS-LIKE 2-like n=1 Tax=Erigeron canadensis TaxID=72917 RepID=UPI001CB9AE57|nr:zinc finger protein CONSTANS-LIKE 2-like [Erigeron canadensis]